MSATSEKSQTLSFRASSDQKHYFEMACARARLDPSLVLRELAEAFTEEVSKVGEITLPFAVVAQSRLARMTELAKEACNEFNRAADSN